MPQIQKGYLFPAIRAFRRTATLQPAVCGQRMMHMPQNRIYNSIRNHEDFTSILLTSTANNIPLITLWTTTWCSTCRTVVPLIREIIENKDSRYLSKECKVNFAEVELDAPDMGWGFGARYMVC
ncbi:hypothetical protein BDZ91DRAFT_138890 [Kalaharituber pfeilii]|nr:hypothetical protein BDZ91DRAFT_138890 [Kalaharituber pfeilii]